jgi:hypothetical protein
VSYGEYVSCESLSALLPDRVVPVVPNDPEVPEVPVVPKSVSVAMPLDPDEPYRLVPLS